MVTKKIRHTLTIVNLVTILFVLGLSGHGYYDRDYALAKLSEPIPDTGPIMRDPGLKVEMVFKGIDFPTSMAFLDENDILVLEKNEGTVRRIVDGVMLENPLLKVNVSTEAERGLLGIAVAKNENSSTTCILVFY